MEGLRDYIEVGLDTCQFTDNELTVTAIIKAVSANSLTVKPISRMGKNVYESNLDTTFKEMFLPRSSFDKIGLEIWSDGRGCDNSAIGCSGYYESYKSFEENL
jgi:hypothetical protein